MDETTRRQFGGGLAAGALITAGAGFELATRGAALPVMRRTDWEPAYAKLERSGELARRSAVLGEFYTACRLCPRACGANRTAGEKGVCRGGARATVSSAHAHFGEERVLVGRGGSGTIFFSHCNLRCVFCQNWEISHRGDGWVRSDEQVGKMMLDLQEQGCHNINLVTPTHFVPSIVRATRWAAARGLRLPLVYNCGGYEPVEVIRLLEGIVDIYLPDFKYMDGHVAARFSAGAEDYPRVAADAIREMHRQTGELTVDETGVAVRGLIIRHLVMPHNLAGTDQFVRWVARELGPRTYVNIMGQYRPEYQARTIPELARRVTGAEYAQAMRWATEAGLANLDS